MCMLPGSCRHDRRIYSRRSTRRFRSTGRLAPKPNTGRPAGIMPVAVPVKELTPLDNWREGQKNEAEGQ